MARKAARKFPTTGYWLFICNSSRWFPDQFLATGEKNLYYKISKHHRHDFQSGQRGMLRVNQDRRSRATLGGLPPLDAGIYAIFEVTGPAQRIADPDPRFYARPTEAADVRWRVPARVLANLLTNPVLASHLPKRPELEHIHRPLETSTIALKPNAFREIVIAAGRSDLWLNKVDAQADTPEAVYELEREYADAEPIAREIISQRIERGRVGEAVKLKRNSRCQVCEALKKNPVAFVGRNGRTYAEAHHVNPVHRRERGSLGHLNIMVLCPNHHRQAHYGNFDVEVNAPDHWLVAIDGQTVSIEKTQLGRH